MALAKSYVLIRELNRPRHPAVLWGLGVALYCCVLLATFRPALAAEARRQVMRQHIKDGMRFAHWAVKRGWPGISLFDDPTYQFSVDMDGSTRRELLAFVNQRAKRRPGHEAMLDVLDVLARDGHAALWARRPAEFAGGDSKPTRHRRIGFWRDWHSRSSAPCGVARPTPTGSRSRMPERPLPTFTG